MPKPMNRSGSRLPANALTLPTRSGVWAMDRQTERSTPAASCAAARPDTVPSPKRGISGTLAPSARAATASGQTWVWTSMITGATFLKDSQLGQLPTVDRVAAAGDEPRQW